MIRIAGQILILVLLVGIIVGPGRDSVENAMRSPESPQYAAPPPAAFSPLSTPTPYTSPKPDSVSEALSRPLFFEGRRIPEPTAVAAAPPPSPLPARAARVAPKLPNHLKLWGIRIDGSERAALIESTVRIGSVWLRMGSAIQDWTVARIEFDSVTLRHGSHIATLKLYEPTPGN